jgi:hypothetical protein
MARRTHGADSLARSSHLLTTQLCHSRSPCPHAPSTLHLPLPFPSLPPSLSLSLSPTLVPSFFCIPFTLACTFSPHLQPSLPWIIPASAHLAHLDRPTPSTLINLCLQILPLPTPISLRLITLTVLPVSLTTLVATISLFRTPKEETGEHHSTSPAEYDNTRLTRMSCHNRVQTPNLVLRWSMLRWWGGRKA